MPKLIVNPTSASRREIKLSRTLLSIGRDPSNDLVLPDAMVSRRHAVIECRGNQYYLRDCNSSNGSVVNGDRISERSLRDGDLVAIGTARLLFREELELESSGAKVVQHPSAPRLLCPGCKSEYRKGDLFCRECGATLQAPAGPPKAVCASCGTAVVLPARFCNACGARLSVEEQGSALAQADSPPEAERTEPPPSTEPPTQNPEVRGGDPPSGAVEAAVAAPSVEDHPPAPTPLGRIEPAARRSPDPPSPRGGAFITQTPDAPARPASPRLAAAPDRPRTPATPPGDRFARARPARAEASSPIDPPAGFMPRLMAGLIDGFLAGLAQSVVVGPLAYLWALRAGGDGSSALAMAVPFALAAVALIVAIGYHVAFWATRGATPGKSWLGLRVVAEDGGPMTFGKAVARGVGYALSAATLGIGFLLIAKDGVGLHDRIGGTRVVPGRRGE